MYILIAYRRSTKTKASDLKVGENLTREQVVFLGGELVKKNKLRKRGENGYEVTILAQYRDDDEEAAQREFDRLRDEILRKGGELVKEERGRTPRRVRRVSEPKYDDEAYSRKIWLLETEAKAEEPAPKKEAPRRSFVIPPTIKKS
jgi:hypothetical protein